MVDTTAGSSPVACTSAVSNGSTFTLSCTPTSALIDTHVYKVTFHASNADDSSSLTTTNDWTEDIPSFVSSSPADGDVVGSGSTTVKATYDEALDPSSSITITDKDGNSLTGGSLTSSSPLPGGTKDTVAYTPVVNGQGLPDGTYFVHVHAASASDAAHGYADTSFNYTVNGTTPQAAPTVTTAGYLATDGTSHWINGENEKAVPFSGTAEPNVRVKVVIYDSNTSPKPNVCGKGACPNDRTVNVGVQPCATPTMVGGVAECPWSLTIDTTNNGGTPDQATGYKWFAVAYTAGGSLSTSEFPIGKDTVAPAPPNGGSSTSASPVGSDNLLTVKTSDDDLTTDSYKFVAVDAVGHSATDDFVVVASHRCGGTTTSLKCVIDTFNVSALQDGEDDYGTDSTTGGTQTIGSSVAPGLVVNVFARDLAGNLSGKTSTSTDKESTNLAPDLSKSYVSLADGSTVPFSALSPGNASVVTIKKPTAIKVWFDELIRPYATSNAFFGDVAMTTNLSVLSRKGFPISGSPTITDGGFSLTWTFSGTATDTGSPYTIANLKAVAGSCPDDGVDLTQTSPGSGNGYCETYESTGSLAKFAIDTTAPDVHITGVNGTGVNNGIDATDIAGTVFSGDVSPDAAQISLTLQSSGGGTQFVSPSAVTITPPASGQSLATWQTTPQNLSSFGDGTVTAVARATDAAGNSDSLDPTVNNPTDGSSRAIQTRLAARPTAPQNLTAAGGNGQAVLSWVAPSYTGNVPLSGYSLTVTDTSVPGSAPTTLSVGPAATTYTVTGLANGHAYSFALTATNNGGFTGPAATTSATPKGNTTLSVVASRGTITYGQFLVVSGTLSYVGVGVANEPVTVTTVYYNGSHGATYHVTTDQSGNWVIAGLSPAKNVTYVASFAGDSAYNASSGAAGVRVRVLVRIAKAAAANSSHLTKVTLSGNVRPNQHGRRVYIYEVLAHGRLHYLGYAKLTTRSSWFFTRAFARGKHTVVARFLNQNGNLGNWSNRARFSRT